MSNDVNSGGSPIHKRLNEARAAIYTADWEPDKAFRIQGNLVSYVSINKMKRNISPILLKYGINFDVHFKDLTMNALSDGRAFWSVECVVTFYDEEGNSMSVSAFGGSDVKDKGVNICQTYALKQVLSNVFLLIDGIDPEVLESESTGSYHKKTDEEIEEVKSEILSNKDVVKKETPKKETPKKETPKKEEPKKEEPKEETPKAEVPNVEKSTESNGFFIPEGLTLTGYQVNALKDILTRWETAAKDGQVTPEEYNKMSMDYASMKEAKDVLAFLRAYRNLKTE